jgi:hypothetical protein
VTGKTKSKKTAAGMKFSGKKGRGSSVGVQEDFGDDFWDDDKYYFGADEGAGRKNGAKPKIRPKTAATQSFGGGGNATPKNVKPVFREDTLKDIFNPKAWVGKTEEMEELWNDVPKRLHKHFDFAAALAEARRDTLKQNAPKQRIALQPNLRPQITQQNTDAVNPPPPNADKPVCPDIVPPPQPPKPPGPGV